MIVLALLACGESAVLVTLKGQVVDYTTNTGLEGATLSFENQRGEPIVADAVTTNAAGDWEATFVAPYTSAAGAEVFGWVEADGYVPTSVHHTLRFADVDGAEATIHPGRLQDPRSLEVEPYTLAPTSDEDGSLSGRVFDAVVANQAAGIGNLTLRIREGIDATDSSPVVATSVTESFPTPGDYKITGLPAGTYTVEILGGDVWSDAKFTAVVVGGVDNTDQNGATSVALADNQFRVVLSWGQIPADVDSHLTGPGDIEVQSDLEDGRFHVFYGNKQYPAGASADQVVVFLDVDDTTSFGPETVTVRRADPGRYKYVLHDYTNGTAGGNDHSQLAASRAKVQLFAGSLPSQTFYVPTGRSGTTWTVFELDGSTLDAYLVSEFGEASSPTDALFY